MSQGIHRSKEPEAVKAKILAACTDLLAQGQSPSIRTVAGAAGVTTGAVQHHFANRSQLLAAFHEKAVTEMEACLNQAQDQTETLSQQYVRASLELFQSPTASQRHKAWLTAAITEPEIAQAWADWLHSNRSTQAESTPQLIARLAADGLWLAELLGAYRMTPSEKQKIFEELSQLAKKDESP